MASISQEIRVADLLRQRMVAGEWDPGSRLPTRDQFIEQLDTSALTLQRAMDRLQKEGFTVSQGSRGTFVAKSPPFLHRYALCLLNAVEHERVAYPFLASLATEAGQFFQSGPSRIRVYDRLLEGGENLERLETDAQAHRIAGMIFTFNPQSVYGDLRERFGGVPSVVINDSLLDGQGVAIVYPDLSEFFEKAFERLRELGSERVAIVTGWPPGPTQIEALKQAFDAGGFELDPALLQFCSYALPRASRNIAHLLTQLPTAKRPDALIVHDELFVPDVVRGLHDGGITIGEDMQVLAHANLPLRQRDIDPIIRLGFSTRQILTACINCIDRARRRRPVPSFTKVPAQFASEDSDSWIAENDWNPDLMARDLSSRTWASRFDAADAAASANASDSVLTREEADE